jgi:hypothetical protein
MKRIAILLVAVAAVAGMVASSSPAFRSRDEAAAPIFGVKIPTGYRDWKLIAVAHEEGNLNDLRAILGNDIAIKAYREGKLPLPDGAMIARLAWSYVPLEERSIRNDRRTVGRWVSTQAPRRAPPDNSSLGCLESLERICGSDFG